MENELYRKVLVPACKAHDGETPTLVLVTEEVNLFAVWRTSYESNELVKHFPKWSNGYRDKAIEYAVKEVNL